MSDYNFHTGGYCPFCLHDKKNCTCMQNLFKFKPMEEETKQPEELKLDLVTAMEYLTEKRDDALEHFCEKVKSFDYQHDCEIHDSLAVVLRLNLQVKTVEDCMLTLKFMNSENKALNTIIENKKKSK